MGRKAGNSEMNKGNETEVCASLSGRGEERPPGPIRNPVLTPEQGETIKRSIRGAKKKRTFRFHMKLVESDAGLRRIEGYASTRDIDRTGEVVEPDAFADSLREFMMNPVLTYMHDWGNPIGKVIDARIDEVGLFIRAEVSETAPKVWKLIEEGVLRAFSIGYEVVEEKVVDGVNHILKLALFEVAVVSIPANRSALFSVSKALEKGDDLVVNDEPSSGREADGAAAQTGTRGFSESELAEAQSVLEEVMERLGANELAS